MKKHITLLVLSLLATGTLQAGTPDHANTARQTTQAVDPWEKRINPDGLLVLEWDDLIPSDFNPDTLFDTVVAKYGIKELDDDDPRAEKVQAEIHQIWNHAPIVKSLNGRRVRLPGLVLPLEGNGKQMSEFLLVPYYGACIHVPPPPSNQIVYVKTGPEKAQVEKMFDAVWVTGTLRSEHQSNAVGDASYTIEAEKVEPYE